MARFTKTAYITRIELQLISELVREHGEGAFGFHHQHHKFVADALEDADHIVLVDDQQDEEDW